MKRIAIPIFAILLITSGIAKAQFAKALPQTNPATPNSEATYNLGIFGGLNTTRWFEGRKSYTHYEQPFFLLDQNAILSSVLNHGLAGIIVERKLGENNAVGIEASYANRWTCLNYNYTYPPTAEQQQYDRTSDLIHRQDSALYHEINIQVPLTQYLMGPENKVRPFVFIAPRFSLPLFGTIHQQKYHTDSEGHPRLGPYEYSIDTLPGQNMRPWNIGAVVGAGLQFRVDLSSYYLLLRLDVSCHYGILNAKSASNENNTNGVINTRNTSSAQVDKLHIGDATAKFTILFPLKKAVNDACMNWGEYD